MNEPLTVYTLPGCVQCDMTKRALDNVGVAYVVIDLANDEQAVDRVKQLGFSSAPVVVAGDNAWSGFRPDRIRALPTARAEKSAS